MDAFGSTVRRYRESNGETLKQMAKALKISEAFARHIESSRTVPVSEQLVDAIIGHYRIGPKRKFKIAAWARYRNGLAYYKQYRAKTA